MVPVFGVLFTCNLWNSEAEEAEAKAFCESLIPQIETIKHSTGKFPEKLDPSWLKDKTIPRLINPRDFYVGDERYYSFHFLNPDRLENLFCFEAEQHVWLNGDSD